MKLLIESSQRSTQKVEDQFSEVDQQFLRPLLLRQIGDVDKWLSQDVPNCAF